MDSEPDSEELEDEVEEESATVPSGGERRRSERRASRTSRDVPNRPTEERRKREETSINAQRDRGKDQSNTRSA